jgi:hypothetical protein
MADRAKVFRYESERCAQWQTAATSAAPVSGELRLMLETRLPEKCFGQFFFRRR